ncbi:hypothetical protein E2C01_068514 [Portunus trituberculatus]|uniref:Uncharacterized protein n=1 Tax=Portunus trituberculatus TaxID=210409 RepID=A0A5B7I0A0_PORTR|nr:hypothetical protein [Portunus trituberculatus]
MYLAILGPSADGMCGNGTVREDGMASERHSSKGARETLHFNSGSCPTRGEVGRGLAGEAEDTAVRTCRGGVGRRSNSSSRVRGGQAVEVARVGASRAGWDICMSRRCPGPPDATRRLAGKLDGSRCFMQIRSRSSPILSRSRAQGGGLALLGPAWPCWTLSCTAAPRTILMPPLLAPNLPCTPCQPSHSPSQPPAGPRTKAGCCSIQYVPNRELNASLPNLPRKLLSKLLGEALRPP